MPSNRILIVDDDAMQRRLFCRTIEGMGLEALCVPGGEEALNVLERGEGVDLVLADVVMPRVDGYSLVRAIRKERGPWDLPVVMVTSMDPDVERVRAAEAGANDFIPKPVSRVELQMRVRSMLDLRRAHLAAEAAQADLEHRVSLRTRELATALDNLRQETGRRRATQMELQLLEAVCDRSLQGICITDAHGDILRVNPAFSRITGYGQGEVLGRNTRLLRSGRHDGAFFSEMWRKMAEEGAWSGEIFNRRKNGEVYPEYLDIQALSDESGLVTHFVGIFHDLTETKEREAQLRFLEHFDALTGLPNRSQLQDRLGVALAAARRGGKSVGLLYLDLDNFRHVNESLGHQAGDRLLRDVADRLRGAVRLEDTVAKLGGDDFVVLLPDVEGDGSCADVAGRVLECFTEPFEIEGAEVFSSASVGIVMSPLDGTRGDELLRNAELAMYRTKGEGKNRFGYFAPEMNERVGRRLELEARLRGALARDEFEMVYQPKLDIKSGVLCGLEALVRWRQADGTLVSPMEFVPLAEETGLIIPLGERILEQACRDMGRFVKCCSRRFGVSVNISWAQFRDPGLVDMVRRTLDASGLEPGRLELEITETCIMRDIEENLRRLRELADLGLRLSIDDFGTGYSSLYYLKHMPLDVLKIDRSFISGVPGDANDAKITETILSLARNFGLRTVAEGVETQAQLEFLRDRGCDEAQGYLFSRPLTVDVVLDGLTRATHAEAMEGMSPAGFLALAAFA